MSEIQRYRAVKWSEDLAHRDIGVDYDADGEYVLYTDHLAALEALKPVPVSMRGHAEAIVKKLHEALHPDGLKDAELVYTIESYLNEHPAGIAEKKDA